MLMIMIMCVVIVSYDSFHGSTRDLQHVFPSTRIQCQPHFLSDTNAPIESLVKCTPPPTRGQKAECLEKVFPRTPPTKREKGQVPIPQLAASSRFRPHPSISARPAEWHPIRRPSGTPPSRRRSHYQRSSIAGNQPPPPQQFVLPFGNKNSVHENCNQSIGPAALVQ